MVLSRLDEVIAELSSKPEPGKVQELWRSAHNLLKKTNADAMKVGRIIAERNVDSLKQLRESGVAELQRVSGMARSMPAPQPAAQSAAVTAAVEAAMGVGQPAAVGLETKAELELTADVLRSAMRAFKKRVKVTQLDDDSKLSNRALTGGSKSQVTAITPPNQYPRAVWDALVADGRLRRVGGGMLQFVRD